MHPDARLRPGFIDIHTHFDAQVFWDPELKPSSYHGVTTVVAGNCGFSIAPCRPEHHDVIVHTLENVEGMDAASLSAGIAWEFETFPDYLDLVGRRGTALNFTAYIGHTALRLYVMGDAAYERAATPEEIERMCQLVGEAMEVGAAGLSTSFSFAHRGVDGKPVPSRFAEMDEVEALFMAVGKAGKGVVLTTPGGSASTRTSSPGSHGSAGRSPARCSPCRAGSTARSSQLHEEALARGPNVWPQVTPRPLTMQFTLADAYNLNVGEVFGELIKVSPGVRKAAYRDQEWRTRAYEDLERQRRRDEAAVGDVRGLRVGAVPRAAGPPGHRHRPGAGRQPLGRHVRTGPGRGPRHPVPGLHRQRRSWPRWGRLLTEDHVVLGLTDAGAHVDQLCDAPSPTDLLGTWVREREIMPLERAVRKLAGEPADMFGFEGRGYLRPGYAADVCVFDPATVAPGPQRRLRDLPADGERLTNEEPTGVRHVMVNGTLIRTDERQLELEELPGDPPQAGLRATVDGPVSAPSGRTGADPRRTARAAPWPGSGRPAP